MGKPAILIVDDDREVLRSIERDLRSCYPEKYQVLRAQSGKAALETLEELKNEQVGELRLRTWGDPHSVYVQLADNGTGIPTNVVPNIFDPFFTTKGVGEGTGLGLDTVQRIVTKHRGFVSVESKPGDTRFTVQLPKQKVKEQEAK